MPSFEDYYKENPNDAIECIKESLDYYVDYKTKGVSYGITGRAIYSGGGATVFYVNCPTQQQANSYYCGPASVYMTIEGIRNHTPSIVNSSYTNTQSSNALAMGTTSGSGTTEAAMRTRLTNMLIGKSYLMDYRAFFTEDEYRDYIITSLTNNGPVILMLCTPFLSYYPSNYSYSSNHYVVVTECVYINGNYTFNVIDPNNWNNGQLCGLHNVTISDLYNNSLAILWINS